jgi:hypothetical protein
MYRDRRRRSSGLPTTQPGWAVRSGIHEFGQINTKAIQQD